MKFLKDKNYLKKKCVKNIHKKFIDMISYFFKQKGFIMEKRIEKLIEIMKEQEDGKKISLEHFGVNKDIKLYMRKKENILTVVVTAMTERIPKITEMKITDMDTAKSAFMFIHENA